MPLPRIFDQLVVLVLCPANVASGANDKCPHGTRARPLGRTFARIAAVHRDTQPVARHAGTLHVPTTTERSLHGPVRVVDDAIGAIQPIVSMWRDGLTVIALDSKLRNRAPDYLTFDDAAASGAVEVHESPAQEVPTVEAVTKAKPVLLLGGDTIIGGAQNRIINLTVLLKAASKTAIPVSCLELGRWNDGRRFVAAAPVDYALRGMVAAQVTRGAADAQTRRRYSADQDAIWEEIGHRQARARFNSATQALHDVYRAEQNDIEQFVRAFPMPPGARGIAVGLFDRLVALDVFDSVETLERQWRRLITSAASAVLDQQRAINDGQLPPPKHRRLHSKALPRMLERASDAVAGAAVNPSVGAGKDVRFQGPKILGAALVHDRRAVHIALFRSTTWGDRRCNNPPSERGRERVVNYQPVYDRLVRAARAKEFVHYKELAKLVGIDTDNPHFAAQVGKILGAISEDEVAAGRPMLSAIVVSKDTMLPGRGFFNIGEELRQTEPGEDEVGFAVRQIKRVHDYWSLEGTTSP